MSQKKGTDGPVRSVLRDKNKSVEDVRKLADVNSAALARVLRGWLTGEKKDRS